MEHPTRNDLLNLLQSEANDQASNLLWQHIENCPDCCQQLETLSNSEPTLLARFKEWNAEHGGSCTRQTPEFADARFVLEEEIALGGMGVVYRGQDNLIDRSVALKTIRTDVSNSDEVEKRFIAEAKLCGQLEHPGIVPVYDMGQLKDGRPYLLMKLIEGKTLQETLADQKENQSTRLLQMFVQVCRAVGFAHSKNIVHRDLKPGNVMVGNHGEVQVMDWGLAKKIGEPSIEESDTNRTVDHYLKANPAGRFVTLDGTVCGTPNYMAPEQANGEIRQIDKTSDVFALGVILYELVVGESLYQGSIQETLEQARNCHVKSRLNLVHEKCDKELGQIIRDCLEVEKSKRPSNAQQLRDRIEAYLDSVDQRIKQAELDEQEALLLAKAERKRRRLTSVFSAAIIVLVLISAGFAYHRFQTAIENERTIQGLVSEVRLELGRNPEDMDEAACLESLGKMEQAKLLFDFQVPEKLKSKVEELEKNLNQNLNELRLASQIRQVDDSILSSLNKVYHNSFVLPAKTGSLFRNADTIKSFEAEFARYEIGPNRTVNEMVGRLRTSKIKGELLRYLNAYRDVVWCNSWSGDKVKWVDELLAAIEGQTQRGIVRQHSVHHNSKVLFKMSEEDLVLEDIVAVECLTHAMLTLEPQGKRKRLKKFLNRVIARYPNHLASHYFLGLSQLENDESLALLHLSIVRAQVLYSSRILNSLGYLKINGHKPAEAISILEEALEHCGEDKFTLNNMSAAYQTMGDQVQASKYAHRLIELHPRYAIGYMNLARIQLAMEKPEEAKKTINEALALEPQMAGALLIASKIEYEMENFKLAARLGAKAFQISYKTKLDYPIVDNVGRCMLAIKNYKGALAAAKTMVKMIPTQGEGWEISALGHMGLEQYDEAIADCNKALVFTKQKRKFHELLVSCYEATNQEALMKKFQAILARNNQKKNSASTTTSNSEANKTEGSTADKNRVETAKLQKADGKTTK